ncbi:unnamed protein product [Musa acuminata subsp. malaccensis]|uniref:(wild Malaysian banana) hypothetical protein n=1 Tax=Musa acuminata subsp. malaccensis TaxID=214687 RepID=A0A804IMV8_MUSAM|nr:PREDICTED: uncharacterized protein LOC103981022 [Musa acuminata subsp. malaccensis]XP_009395867.1 PREDICTED: uncharacterized protein LOC103981022 [Musa acuminata subsp. malaccensis]CAG1841680.1 unnamed protein product [Musa acuminata subsp. malaccensis]
MLQRQPSLPPPMLQPQPPVTKHSRTHLSDLKSQIAKRLGHERANNYFSYLNGLLSQRLSNREFNKLCILTLGHENLPLHNQLIRSILQNACQEKAPPVNYGKFAQRSTVIMSKTSPQVDDGLDFSQARTQSGNWSNGDILPRSPCKFKSGIDNHSIYDHPGPLRPNGKVEVGFRENGVMNSCNLKRPLQRQQDGPCKLPTKRTRIEEPSLHDQGSVHNKVLSEAVLLEHVEDVDCRGSLDSHRHPLRAPLGIPFSLTSIGKARRTLLSAGTSINDGFCRNYDCSELYHTEVLKKRMDKMAQAQGLEGVTMDCANLLNNGLDAYLKRLIKSCIDLVGTGTEHVSTKRAVPSLLPYAKPINGVWARSNIQRQGSVGPLIGTHMLHLKDFRVAMELNPQQLGGDWSLLLEKICVDSFEE